MKDSRTLLAITMLALITTACAPYRPASGKAARCNELNSQIVFNGSTGNTRQANIEKAEAPLINHNYDKDDCAR